MKFNWQRYIELNPDLIEAGIDNECSAMQHYLNHGIDENRRYGSAFLLSKITGSPNSAYMILIKAIDQIANNADDQRIRDCIISTLKLSKNIKEPFVPPKPNELLKAYFISTSLLPDVLKSRSHSGS